MLIASSNTNKAERDADINLSLPGDGYEVFFRAKRALELQCPGVVSCADVMAIATRDLLNLVKHFYYCSFFYYIWKVGQSREVTTSSPIVI